MTKFRSMIVILVLLLIFSPIAELGVNAAAEDVSSDFKESFEIIPIEPLEESKEVILSNLLTMASEGEEPKNELVCPDQGESEKAQSEGTLPRNPDEQAPPEEGEIRCPDPEVPSERNPDEIHGITAVIPITFTDVPNSHWAYSNISHLSLLRIINGYQQPDQTYLFQPENKVTRAQAAKMIIEAIGEKEAQVTVQQFKDVPVGNWAAGYIQRAYELGIFGGYADGRFGPSDTLKRSQMAKVIAEAYKFDFNGYTQSTPVFHDVSPNYWAYEYIEKLHYNGITNGSNYRFLPEELISRAQFSAFLSRVIDPRYRLKVTGPVISGTKGKVTSKTALNIRATASSSAKIVGTIPTGTTIGIQEFNGYWAKVTYNGITGFVHKSYLKLYSDNPNLPLKGRVIILDPGHGAHDPGATLNGIHEKDIVLSVAHKVATRLKAAGATVIMTRDTDIFYTPQQRVEYAQKMFAEVFISIHVNSVKNNTTANGTEIYFNTSANQNGEESKLLATEIQKQIVTNAKMTDRGVKNSEFYVVKNLQIPAILIELGFLPNSSDRSKLVSEEYQNIFAESIYQGIRNYYLK